MNVIVELTLQNPRISDFGAWYILSSFYPLSPHLTLYYIMQWMYHDIACRKSTGLSSAQQNNGHSFYYLQYEASVKWRLCKK